jgi:hypothetical protein
MHELEIQWHSNNTQQCVLQKMRPCHLESHTHLPCPFQNRQY